MCCLIGYVFFVLKLIDLTSSLLMTEVYLMQPGDWIVKQIASHIMVTHLDPHTEQQLFSGHSEDFINIFQICFVLKQLLSSCIFFKSD